MSSTSGRKIRVLRCSFPERPVYDTAFSRVLLERVGQGLEPDTVRLHQPGDVIAFGPRDRGQPGFTRAVEAARHGGFEAVLRLAGGRAAVFHSRTLAFSWTQRLTNPRAGIADRFDEIAEIVAAALCGLGLDARVGEVPGEYCPGAHSVNARGRSKLMGVGQRVIRDAVYLGGVVVVGGSDRVREILTPVYQALQIPWQPETAGSVEDEIGTISVQSVAAALLQEFEKRYAVREENPSEESLNLAESRVPDHRIAKT